MRATFLPALELLPNIGLIAMLGYGGHQVLNGDLTLGELVGFNVYVVMLIWPLRMLGMIIAQGQRSAAAAERVDEILDTAPVIVDTPAGSPLPAGGPAAAAGARCASRACGSPTRPSCPIVLDGFDLDRPGRPVGGPRRRHRVAARPPSPGSSRASTTCSAARSRVDGVDVRDVRRPGPAQGRRHRVRGHVPVLRQHRRQHRLRRPRRLARGDRAGGPPGRRRRVHRARCPRATTRRSASGASRCRAASASASPSPGRSSPTPGC